MLLDTVHKKLGWPSRAEVLKPSGAGPSVYARLVQSKLGRVLSRRDDIQGVEVGILASEPGANATEPPLAVVCEFNGVASPAAIEHAHRLAWNFCRAPLLVTLERHLIRAWTTCERPRIQANGTLPESEIESLRIDPRNSLDFSDAATRSLSWVSLVSGQLFREHVLRFPRKQCADETLLDNLSSVRDRLIGMKLPVETVHDLLARLIFVQFLFHRKDDRGNSALTPEWLAKQHEARTLTDSYTSLEAVLRNYTDAYALFRLLNERFNGDLFPGKATDPQNREGEWLAEMKHVKPVHLSLLADFVGGMMQIGSGQRSLWPLYSFDVIPLEFISSVYEAFVNKVKGTHYTPAYLVDVVLDTCLPWDSNDWDVRVLDPACGSGIFLVKAFQRLVYRWRRANRFRKKPDTDILRKLLTENLFGVDIQTEAVRVACFSLYLAMCDELEPRHLWDRVKFPLLRESRLVAADFFREDVSGFGTFHERQKYDIVVGNAPWGTGTAKDSPCSRKWAKAHKWEISYNDIGPLFLAKSAKLTKLTGSISMLQSSGLLFKTSGKAASFRGQLLKKYNIEQIINLSALRFGLFADAVGPACVVCMSPTPPAGSPITYVAPKPSHTVDDEFRIVFEAYDYHSVYPEEALEDSGIWTALMWGSRRDYSLIVKLSSFSSIAKLEQKKLVKTRVGIIWGDRSKRETAVTIRPLLDADYFPNHPFPFVDATELPVNRDPFIHSKDSTDFDAFDSPQLILKLSWLSADRRFHARIVQPQSGRGVICTQSYVSVHFEPGAKSLIDSACLVYNSKLATYYMLLTSSHLASFRQKVQTDEILRVPLPERVVTMGGVKVPSDLDSKARDAFPLKPAEWTLIDDVFDYTLQGFTTAPAGTADLGMLQEYGEAFVRVLRAGFGKEKRVRVTIYRTPDGSFAPVHLVAVYLDWPGTDQGIHCHDVNTQALLDRIVSLAQAVEQRSSEDKIIHRRAFHVYETTLHGRTKVPTVYLCKPNLPRYWTRSMAMRDADVVSADLVRMASAGRSRRRSAHA